MKRHVIWAILFSFIPILAWPSSIVRVKGDRALIAMDGEQPIAVGQAFYTIDSAGKKRALVKVIAIKENRAVAKILRGKSAEGHRLLEADIPDTKVSQSETTGDSAAVVSDARLSRFGVLGGWMMNKMDAKFSVSGTEHTTNMTGNGVSVLGFYDYAMGKLADIRISAGLEQFQVSENRGTPDCSQGTTSQCNALINYLSSYALYKYTISGGSRKIWLGAGGGLLLALSKSSTVLKSSQISTNTVMTAATGIEFAMKQGQYLPVVIEYSMFPTAPSVNANYIAIRVGWGWR
jgi:hypothetical protein